MGVYRFLSRRAPPAAGLPPGADVWRYSLLDRVVDGMDERCDVALVDARDRLDGLAAALAAWAHAADCSQEVNGGRGTDDEGAIVLPSARALA